MPGESEKPVVFSHLFRHRYDTATGGFTASTVMNTEVQEAILLLAADEGLTLRTTNPANILKDFLRSWSRNDLWPADVAAAGYTARQAYGDGAVFDFVPYLPGQTEPDDEQALLAIVRYNRLLDISWGSRPTASKITRGQRCAAWARSRSTRSTSASTGTAATT